MAGIPPGGPLTERDRELLVFLAEHRLVLTSQVQTLLGVSADAADRRVRALSDRGYISRRRVFCGEPACCHIRLRGLAAVGSDLPAPRPNLAYYEHDVGLAWIWLAAMRGTLGPLREVISERRMRSHDGRLGSAPPGGRGDTPVAGDRSIGAQSLGRLGGIHLGDHEPLGVRLGGFGSTGQERLHYPDLLLVKEDGKRIAVELELSSKGRARLEGILLGYASEFRVEGVLYLVADRAAGRRLGQTIRDSARRLGMDGLVAVRRLRIRPPGPSTGGRAPGRDVRREHALTGGGGAGGPARELEM